jgi:hypothetical protein
MAGFRALTIFMRIALQNLPVTSAVAPGLALALPLHLMTFGLVRSTPCLMAGAGAAK